MWRLDGSIAHFETKQLTCCIDLFQPTKGLLNLTVLKQQLLPPEFQILQIHTGETETESTLVDAYVRGSDLVAMYSETKHRQVRVQVYWRWLAQYEQAFGMEVILSVQTSQLDVQTAIETVSMLSTAPEQPCERLYLFALRPIPLMYTEMVHPSNALDSRLQNRLANSELCELRNRFFPGSLEKGVLHRSMVLGMFSGLDQRRLIDRIHEEFLAAPPPLTT